jgi:heme-degrading monooxygenase HmoA
VIRLAELDESTPYRDQLKAASAPVTIINTFVAPEGNFEEVLAAWKHDAEYMTSKPGFISAQLYRGIAGSRVITNIAVWESAEHLAAAFGTPEFAQHMARYPDGTVAYPHLYQKAAVEGVCEA